MHFGKVFISRANYLMAGRISFFRLLIGSMNLKRVVLSTMNKAYFTPFIALFEPKNMSIWTTSPKFLGRSNGVVFLFDLSIVDTSLGIFLRCVVIL